MFIPVQDLKMRIGPGYMKSPVSPVLHERDIRHVIGKDRKTVRRHHSHYTVCSVRKPALHDDPFRLILCCEFIRHAQISDKHLDARKIPYCYLDGSTAAAQRRNQVDLFQSGAAELFLISLKAGGLGLNLTAADYVIHMDPWWNPAVEDQAADRAHRIGQTRPVTVYRLMTVGTIEEKIVQLHHKKRDLANSLLEGTDVSARIGVEELLELIRGE